MSRTKPEILLKPKLLAVSVAACFALNATALRANPNGPTVVHGSVGFNGLGTSALTITNQAGGNAIINWNGFSIGVNELTRFQQFANLAVLNRVTGSEISSILGRLQSDGRVFLINPNGIVFGASARIDTAGLVASSLGLSDQDFLANRLRFTEVPGAGAVVNNGVIETTSGGRVYLVAPTVENNGLIHSPQGAIVLAAGKEVELVDADSPFVTVKVASAEQAVNLGTLVSDGGQIGIFGALVANSGVVQAGGAVAGPGGEIRLVATKDLEVGGTVTANGTSGGKVLLQAEGGTNLVSGTVEAKGSSGSGGTIDALGVRVGVVGHGLIDASGDTGGGTVRVGGDYQGANADVQNAERTYIGSDGVIRADAMTTGDGGRVIVWADGDTRFYGSISATGGSESGNGGFVETSGRELLDAFGSVNVSAQNGSGGNWLLDPKFVEIVSGLGLYGGFVEFGGTYNYFDIPIDDTISTVGVDAINAGLAYGSVTIQAVQDISLRTNVDLTNSGDLTLQAGDNIHMGAYGISMRGNLTLTANDFLAQQAYGAVPTTAAITSSAGGGNITTRGGSLTASGRSVTLGNINTSDSTPLSDTSDSFGGNGDVSILATTGDIVTGSITTRSLHPYFGSGGSVFLRTSTGTITVNGAIDSRGANGSTIAPDTCGDGCDDFFYYGGSAGGDVTLARNGFDEFAGTAIRVDGSILATGGSGVDASDGFTNGDASGGNGGDVVIGNCSEGCFSLSGNIVVTGEIATSGGSGATVSDRSTDTQGGDAGSVEVFASGSIGISSVRARGGAGGDGSEGSPQFANWANHGGQGGGVDLFAQGPLTVGAIDVSGGRGGNGSALNGWASAGGEGGAAGGIFASSSTSVNLGSLAAIGGQGGSGGAADQEAVGGIGGHGGTIFISGGSGGVIVLAANASGGHGGSGGIAAFNADGGIGYYAGSITITGQSITTGALTATGGNGGAGGIISALDGSSSGGHARDGGSVQVSASGYGGDQRISALGPVATGPIDVSGGTGGNSGAVGSSRTFGGDGGGGGFASVFGTTVNVGGPILARGGAGGSVLNGSLDDCSGDCIPQGGDGGWGGEVMVAGEGLVQINIGGALGALAIDVSGGNGGNGNPASSPAGDGGAGGTGGDATVVGTPDMTLFGSVLAGGGDGGAGGAGGGTGGAGGNSGTIFLDASSSFDTQTGDGIIFVLAGTSFDVEGGFGGTSGGGGEGLAGTTGTFVQNSDYFGTIVILDPLSVTEVNQGYQQIVEGNDDTTAFVGGEKEEEEEDQSQKELGSCQG